MKNKHIETQVCKTHRAIDRVSVGIQFQAWVCRHAGATTWGYEHDSVIVWDDTTGEEITEKTDPAIMAQVYEYLTDYHTGREDYY